jgi:hypothetical protein
MPDRKWTALHGAGSKHTINVTSGWRSESNHGTPSGGSLKKTAEKRREQATGVVASDNGSLVSPYR